MKTKRRDEFSLVGVRDAVILKYAPRRFLVYAVFFAQLLQRILLERRLDRVEDVKDVLFLGP